MVSSLIYPLSIPPRPPPWWQFAGNNIFSRAPFSLMPACKLTPHLSFNCPSPWQGMLHMRLTAPRDGAHGVRGAHGMAYINLTSPPPKRVPILAPWQIIKMLGETRKLANAAMSQCWSASQGHWSTSKWAGSARKFSRGIIAVLAVPWERWRASGFLSSVG